MGRATVSRWKVACLGLTLLFMGADASAEVKLPKLISDDMVLQEDMKVRIWGTADPGERVAVAFRDQKVATETGSDGRWEVYLQPMKVGGPDAMTVSGNNRILLKDILVGEVWVCLGSSNMHFSVGSSLNGQREVAAASYPMIRLFTVPMEVAGQPQGNVEGQWTPTSPQTVETFSAVSYFFGRDLYKALGVPIGLIHGSWGATQAESWTSRSALNSVPEVKSYLEERDALLAQYPKQVGEFQQQYHDWLRAVDEAEADGKDIPSAAPRLPEDPRASKLRPAGLYNAMIAPLTPYSIRGTVWYQAAANSRRSTQYRKLFPAMIQDWRRAWGEGNIPFLFVQLANYEVPDPKSNWPEAREAGSRALSLPKTGMAETIDIGDPKDIHPKNKQEVGRRLALAAQAIAYGRDVVYSGPIYESMTGEGSKIQLTFKHTDGGLVAKGGGGLKGFEVAGEDRRFVPAKAIVQGDAVVVRSPQVAKPVAIRYAWADNPTCNLYNKAGLPASPFRTDDWPSAQPEEK